MPSYRRTRIRRAAALGLAGLLVASGACAPSDATPDGLRSATDAPEGRLLARPTLAPGKGGAVHIVAPSIEPPVAYLSRGEMRIYVGRSDLDWAQSRLAAYVSVTTGLWRIRRPEDDPGVPIIPGDTLREFEVVDISLWDPEMKPVEGDVRLRRGAPVPVRTELACVPVLTDDGWVTAGTVEIQRRDGPAGEGGREDFVEVGEGTRHADGTCIGAGQSVRLLTWAVSPERDEA